MSDKKFFTIPEVEQTQTNTKLIKNDSVYGVWVYLVAGAFLGLVVVTAFTFWISMQRQQVNTVTVSSSSRAPVISDLLTGGGETPATKSKVTSAIVLTEEWLQKNFSNRPTVLESGGSCVKMSVCNESADPDQDGLLNMYEFQYGTDPNDPDTDKDGLIDTLELFVYFSNPKLVDSNNDISNDFDSLVACKDPIDGEILGERRKSQISNDLSLFPMKQPTIRKLQEKGATNDDINKFGYISSTCESVLQN